MGEIIFQENFENDTDWTHNVKVFPVDGAVYETQVPNVFSPQHWLFWHRHQEGVWSQPEAHHIHSNVDLRRIYSGDTAYMFFGFWRNIDAGLMRSVAVERGRQLRLTAQMHSWSNGLGTETGGHPDDGRWSDGSLVGYKIVALKPSDIPPLCGDEQVDANSNACSLIGIDPTGGTDPFAPCVVWSESRFSYNGYVEQLVVETTATSDNVTVFVRGTTLFALKHLDFYVGEVVLEYVDDVPSPPGGCAAPRTDYARTVVLLPPNYSVEWWQAAATGGHPQRLTISGSADDAGLGVGCLTNREVLAVNPNEWGDDLEAFFETHYPGVNYTAIQATTPADLGIQLLPTLTGDIALSQNNPLWKDDDLGECPGGETIGAKGCLLNCAAMTLRQAYGVDVTPPMLNWLLAREGIPFYDDDHLNWVSVVSCFGKFSQAVKRNAGYSADNLRQLLGDGWLVNLYVSGPHFVYLVSVEDNDNLLTIDPWNGEHKLRTTAMVLGIRAALLEGEPIPPPPPLPPPPGTGLGPHVLRSAGRLEEYASVAPITKYVGDWGSAKGKLIIGRLICDYDAQAQRTSGETSHEAARRFIQDQLPIYQANPHIKYWEGHNEPVWSSTEEMAWYAQFEIERMKLMADEGLKCVIGNFATGTPPLNLWPAFLPALREVSRYKAILGLHEYSCPWMWWMTGKYQLDPAEDQGDEGWTTLRYRKVYRQYLEPAGLGNVPLVITECGLDPLVNPKPTGCNGGTWKQLHGYWAANQNGEVSYISDDAEYYFRQLEWYDKELQKDSYVLGATVFCWGNFGLPWADYDVANTAVEDKLIAYAEGEEPPSPPPPSTPLLVGLHDQGGGDWMKANGMKGICLTHLQVREEINRVDFSHLELPGVRVLCRLNWGYADGTGTLPPPDKADAWVAAMVATIRQSSGVWGWIIGNEINNLGEHPHGFRLTPEYVVKLYNSIWRGVGTEDLLAPPPIDPYYGPGSNNADWQRYIWNNITGADWIALHCKTQTNNPAEIQSRVKFSDDPLRWQYLHWKTYETSLGFVPERFKSLPVFITEGNPQCRYNIGGETGWLPDNAEWVRESVRDILQWNQGPGHQQINGIVYYRYEAAGAQAPFGLCNMPVLLSAIREVAS